MLVIRSLVRSILVVCAMVVAFCPVLYAADDRSSIPAALYDGMVKFKLNSGDYFDALTMMNERYINEYPVDYTTALYGYGLLSSAREQIGLNNEQKSKLSPDERFSLGELHYKEGDCIGALGHFKSLKGSLSLEDKPLWIYYRSNCFIQLGSPQRAAKALRELVGGLWASYAYYNLGIAYAKQDHDKTKALGTLWIADSLNKAKTKQAQSLKDRINLASGQIYLQGGKPDLALDFFKKIQLQSTNSAEGLYLNGLSHFELGDFRSATQSWFRTKSYPLTIQSVAEAALAIPYAYDSTGYVSQALEAYHEATAGFENELRTIDRVDKALKDHGAASVLIDAGDIKGLEWFLSKGVVKNTVHAAYYSYFVADNKIHDEIKLYKELRALQSSIEYWQSQLSVFDKALKNKKGEFRQKSASFKPERISHEIKGYKQQVSSLSNNVHLTPSLSKDLRIDALTKGVSTLENRLSNLQTKVKNGQRIMDEQISQSLAFNNRLVASKSDIQKLLKKIDEKITQICRDRLAGFKKLTLANYERSEQGLIRIMQSIAENKYDNSKKRSAGRRTR